jgi:hypothetical protein
MASSIGRDGTQRGNGSNRSARSIVKPTRSTAAVSRPRWQAGPERGEAVLPAGQAPAAADMLQDEGLSLGIAEADPRWNR